MVIMIGGSSHVGKTLLAQKLVEELHYSCISLDLLKMGFIKAGLTRLTASDDYKLRYWMWTFVREIIKTAIDNQQNLIVEGCYIPENWKDGLESQYLKEIRCVFIVMSPYYIENNFDKIKGFSNIIEKRSVDESLDMERLIQCSLDFKQDCISNGTPYIEIDKDFNLEELKSQIRSILA